MKQESEFSYQTIVIAILGVALAISLFCSLMNASIVAQGERNIKLASMGTIEDINGRTWLTHLPFDGFRHSTAKMSLAISKGQVANDIQLHLRVQYAHCCNKPCIENFSIETDSLILNIGPNDYYNVKHELDKDDFLVAYYTTAVDSAILQIVLAAIHSPGDILLRCHPVASNCYMSMIVTNKERKAMNDVLQTFWSIGGHITNDDKLNYQYKSTNNERK